ncbi:unnamed protein product [Penicillium palitans]
MASDEDTAWFSYRNFTSLPEELNAMPSMSFGATYAVVNAINQFAQNWATGSISFSPGYDVPVPSAHQMFGIWAGSVDMDAWIHNVALSVTNHLRSISNTTDLQNFEKYAGTATTNLAFVHVRWGWIAYPAAMVTRKGLGMER